MKDAYNPDTLEHISTDTPADWMLRAGVSAPAYNPDTESCYFRNGAWVIVIATPDAVRLADDARRHRKTLMGQCDWTQLPDTPLDTIQRAAWASYRQALRDISKQAGFPVVIDWPVAP